MNIMNPNTIKLIKSFAVAFSGGAGLVLGQWALKKATHQPDEALVVNVNQFAIDKDGNVKTVDET